MVTSISSTDLTDTLATEMGVSRAEARVMIEDAFGTSNVVLLSDDGTTGYPLSATTSTESER